MLSIQDVIDYCDLERGEIEAIAEHESVPLTVAAEMSQCLLTTPEGVYRLHEMIVENMATALEHGSYVHVRELAEVYEHLQRLHPLPQQLN